jgi:serine/threonine protein kinase/WD40 repeat protein/tetratricopeptide (TPR) repeat protein
MNDDNPSDADPFGQIADEFVEAFRQGKRPSVEDFARRYPEHADEIREMLPALVLMEKAKSADDASGEGEKVVAVATVPALRQLGDYQILREVGRGGMGVVYEARQLSLGRHVAIKVLPSHALLDPRHLGRFQREARSAAKLHHTNIVPVFGVGEQDGLHYYVMQFIQGLGLDVVLSELRRLRQPRGKQAPTRGELPGYPTNLTLDISAVDVARGLLTGEFRRPGGGKDLKSVLPEPAGDPTTAPGEAAAGKDERGRMKDEGRQQGASDSSIIHHPSSSSSATIRLPGQSEASTLSESGSHYWQSVARVGVQVADALAHAATQGVLHRDIKPSNLLLDETGNVWVTDFGLAKAASDSDELTHTGDIIGTMRYMAPERFNGQGDLRSDVYSLGLTLYELLALRPAFDEADRNKLVKQVMHDEPVRPRKVNKGVPRDLETVVIKAIARDPRHRYQTPAEMAEDLKRFVDDRPVRARRISEAERLWRWCRRNPGLAVLGGALAAVLVLVTVASLLAAGYFNRLRWNEARAAKSERDARQEAELSREAESSQRQRAEQEKRRADITLADMYTSRGLLAGDRDAAAEAALWFAAAADQSVTAEDPRRHEDNRLRARNWMRQATLPVAALSLSGGIHQLDFQPRGDLLLVRFGMNEVIFWSWRDGKRLPWAEKLAGVGSAQFSPDGASVALGLHTGEVQLRKASDGELLAKVQHEGPINALAFSSDGKFLAVASHIARVWDIKGQAFRNPVWAHPQGVSALVFNRRGDRLITACGDQRARVFAVESRQDRKEPLYAPVVHAAPSAPALIDEDRILVTVSGDSELTRWDMATGKPAGVPIRTRPRLLQGVVASSDGSWFVAGGYYGPELYAADANQPPVHLSHTNWVKKYAFSPDNTMLLSASWDQTARIWSLPHGQPLGQPLKHMANVEACAWSHDSRYMATAQNDGLIRVWQRPDADLVIAQESAWGQRPRLSFDGRLVAPGLWHESAMGNRKQNVMRLRVVAAANGQPAGPDISLPGVLVDSCVCGDNRAVAAVLERGKEGLLGVWDVATAHARLEPIPLPAPPISVAARPGSGQLAVICATGDLLVIDDITGKRVLELRHEGWAPVPPGRQVQVRYTPDGETLVSLNGAPPTTVNVHDADTGRLRFAPLRPTVDGSNFHSFSLSADSRLLATMALVKNYAQVWDLVTGRALSEPLPHPGDFWGLFSVRFSPDGRYLLTSHKDGQNRYWDWQAGKLACPSMAHDSETHDGAITPDGRYVLTVIGRPEMHVWELATGRRVAPPVRLGFREGTCSQLAITPDGRRALVGFWPLDLAVVDLEALLSPSTTPPTDLGLLAELATAQRIELGDLSSMTTDQWLERWNLLRERNPGLARSFLSEPNPAAIARKQLAQAADSFRQGEAHARQGRWKEAAVELAKVARLYPTDVRFRIFLANLLLQKGDEQGYRKLCEDVAKELDQLPFDPMVANNTVWLFCLGPGAVTDYKGLVALAERAVKEHLNEQQRVIALNTLGVILYRAGRYQEAIDRLHERVKAGAAAGAPVDWVFLAMAHHRLGHKSEANRWLEKLRAHKVPDLRTSSDLWNDLEIPLFTREVEALLREEVEKKK